MKGYGEYKTVDAQWLGAIPSHWESPQLREVLKERKEKVSDKDFPPLSVCKAGIVPQLSTAAKSNAGDNRKGVRTGDFVINSRSDRRGSSGISKYEGSVSLISHVLCPRGDVVGSFLHYLLRSHSFIEEFYRNGRGIVADLWTTRFAEMKTITLPIPPREEQDQIVRYLDAKVGKINKLIKIKQQQIALLKEKKQAIINQAVTKGLDPNTPMKDSGIAWIGQIPEGWEVLKIKQVAKILRGKFNHRPRNDERLYGGKFPFIQTGDVAQSGKYIESYKQTLNSLGFAVSKEFPIGTLVMTIAANIGDVSILKFNACFPDSIVGFIPWCANIEYLYFLFLTMKPELLKEAPVNTQGNLNVERIGQMLIPLPEESIQEAIVQKLNLLDSLYQKKITIIGEEIATLTEYRTRLLSDVVTGRVDVRGALVDEELNEDQKNSTSGHQWLAQSDEDEYSVDEDDLTE